MRKLQCPKCNAEWEMDYWKWVWKAPFHTIAITIKPFRVKDKRKTKCPRCGETSWITSK